MRVEAHAFAAYGRGYEQASAGFDHARKLLHRLLAASRIDPVAVTTETDMLDHMQARQRFDAVVGERKPSEITANAGESRQRHTQWPIVYEQNRQLGAQHAQHHHTGPHVDVLLDPRLPKTPRQPRALKEIV